MIWMRYDASVMQVFGRVMHKINYDGSFMEHNFLPKMIKNLDNWS